MTKILVIDDESSSRLILQNRMKERGYGVVLAETGAQGLLEAKKASFDVTIVDDNLGSGVDGFEVCRRLKQAPETLLVPVIMVHRQSGGKEDAKRAYAAGCDHFLTKNELHSLEDVIEVQLRHQREMRDVADQAKAVKQQVQRAEGQDSRGSTAEGLMQDHQEQIQSVREFEGGCPDATLIVDAEGVVRTADRGAREFFGARIEGEHLGRLAPASGLEAFVRDSRTERDGFRFDLPARSGRPARAVHAAVVPLVPAQGEPDPGRRIVLLMDAGRRKVRAELLRLRESHFPPGEFGVLVDLAHSAYSPTGLLGVSPCMDQIRSLLGSMATSDNPILIRGEAGTGKKHVARCLHYTGRRTGPFIPVYCGAHQAGHQEAELFGQIKGYDADSLTDRPGALVLAQHGTVLLEDIDALTPESQKRLLRALRSHEVQRMGGERIERTDARIIATTQVDLEAEVQAGRFDKELYAAIDGFELEVDPLRDRREDIPVLVQAFLLRYGSQRSQLAVSDDAMWVLESYGWQGNVRELASAIEQACARCEEDEILVEHLPQGLRDLHDEFSRDEVVPPQRDGKVAIGGTHTASGAHGAMSGGGLTRVQREYDINDDEPVSLALYEKKALLRALHETGNDKLAAARLLKVGKSTLYRKLKRFDIK